MTSRNGGERDFLGQGATEYLVLLAVVLIIALVAIALLGFFPGMSQDAAYTQSVTYWKSASPIAIIETAGVRQAAGSEVAIPYLRLQNVGGDPIIITKLWLGSNSAYEVDNEDTGPVNLSDYYTIYPGEEKYIGGRYGSARCVMGFDVPDDMCLRFNTGADSSPDDGNLGGATKVCTTTGGYIEAKDFGFEYLVNVGGQWVTKKQIGAKPLLIRCRGM